MDIELLLQIRRAEKEREVARLRLLAAARANGKRQAAETPAAPQAAPAIPLRLLRALRLAS